MKAVIIDDDPSMRENLRMMLSAYAPGVEIIGEADGVKSGVSLLQTVQPELVFLDVDMQDGTGFDVLSLVGSGNFHVIFVTGHDKYAIKAFKYSAIDYLLKPVDTDDLVRAINKAMETSATLNRMQVDSLIRNQQSTQKKHIVLNDAQNAYLVDISDIVRCEAQINYTAVHTKDGQKILISRPLKHMEEMLDGHPFFRCHQSHLIQLPQIKRFEKAEGGQIVLINGEIVPVASRKRDELLLRMKGL